MTIEVRKSEVPTSHEENLFWEVRCYTCPDFSEEDGTTFDPPQTIADFTKELSEEQARQIAEEHKGEYGDDHRLVISYLDISAIREALWGGRE